MLATQEHKDFLLRSIHVPGCGAQGYSANIGCRCMIDGPDSAVRPVLHDCRGRKVDSNTTDLNAVRL